MAAAPAQEISREQACEFLARFDFIEPNGRPASVRAVVARGWPFLVQHSGGQLVYVLEQLGPDAWITAAGGTTRRAALDVLQLVELQARMAGLRRVCFQTVRPGLMRLATRAGYLQSGAWTFTKELRNG